MTLNTDRSILVVDDDVIQQAIIQNYLKKFDLNCIIADNGIDALEILEKTQVDAIISDLHMPEMTGLELFREIKKLERNIPFIIVTVEAELKTAVQAIKEGVTDYIQKPINKDELRLILERSISHSMVLKENTKLKRILEERNRFADIVVESDAMRRVMDLSMRVAGSPFTIVSLFGESGVGKEVIAKAIYRYSGEFSGTFVAVNCAALPASLLESELFGYEKGAFTGAFRDKPGKFDEAQGGALLLDEIGDFPLELQPKLLRVIEQRKYERLGGNIAMDANFRIITATSRNLRQMVAEGKFREELYHRINAFPIHIPPLRDRKEDIPYLVKFFLDNYCNKFGKSTIGVSTHAMKYLIEYNWPGNIRELRNFIERAAILSDGSLLQVEDFHFPHPASVSPLPTPGYSSGSDIMFNMAFDERDASLDNIIEKVKTIILEYTGGNKKRAAEILRRDRNFFYYKRK